MLASARMIRRALAPAWERGTTVGVHYTVLRWFVELPSQAVRALVPHPPISSFEVNPMKRPVTPFLMRAWLLPGLVSSSLYPVTDARARSVVVEPAEAASDEEPTVVVDTSEIPDFDASLARQLSVEATKQAKEYDFDPTQITITIVWLDAASAIYGIHVYIETSDARLSNAPLGPMLKRCEQCSQSSVPNVAVEALRDGIELYEHTRNNQRDQCADPNEPGAPECDCQALEAASQISEGQEHKTLRRHRAAGIILLSLGSITHALGITLMALSIAERHDGRELRGRRLYIPGMLLLSLSPVPIATGAVHLAHYEQSEKKRRATAGLMGLRRGLGLGATIRF